MLRATLLYFGTVFGTGFLLGPVRILYLVPRVGERVAELLEMPVMLTVIVLSARAIVRRYELSVRRARFTGLAAFLLLLVAEFGLVLTLRGLTVHEYIASRDPVSGTAYYMALVVFAAMPEYFARRGGSH